MALYAQTSGTQSTNSGAFVSIPGLTLTIPAGVNDAALVVVNLPNPYATGSDYPGAFVGISVDGTISPVQACFTYSEQQMPFPGRVPTTLVVSVPLTNNPQTVNAVWYGVRGSTVIIDSPATMSAVFG